jgi:hypothetical protein
MLFSREQHEAKQKQKAEEISRGEQKQKAEEISRAEAVEKVRGLKSKLESNHCKEYKGYN